MTVTVAASDRAACNVAKRPGGICCGDGLRGLIEGIGPGQWDGGIGFSYILVMSGLTCRGQLAK
jgi:hypothetical protein